MSREASESAVLYLRESFHRSGREKYSLEAQEQSSLQYAAAKGLQVLRIFRETQSGWKSGRPVFRAMLAFVAEQTPLPAIVMTHVDCGARNHADYAALRQLSVERHYVSESQVVAPRADSGARLIEVVRAEMAEQESEKISARVGASMREKAEMGLYPSCAPPGYRNVTADGQRLIEPHEEFGPIVAEMFERHATGTVGIHGLADWVWEQGLRTRTGGKVHHATIAGLLRRRVYCGEVEWGGVLVEGRHDALVTRTTWRRVQDVLAKRQRTTERPKYLEFLFSGLINCGCGRKLSGYTVRKKNGRSSTYYKCTRQNRERCGAKPASEIKLVAAVAEEIATLSQAPEALQWLRAAITRSLHRRQESHDATVRRLRSRHDSIGRRIRTAYEEHLRRLEGSPAPDVLSQVFEEKTQEWADEQASLRAEIEVAERKDLDLADRANQIFKLAAKAGEIWENGRSTAHRRDLLGVVASNCTWDGASLTLELAQPFDALALLASQRDSAGSALARLAEGDSLLLNHVRIFPRGKRSRRKPTLVGRVGSVHFPG